MFFEVKYGKMGPAKALLFYYAGVLLSGNVNYV
jgi:hypothetical protein